ncbi:cellulase family glycosylhydrolase [Flammeovirgaceae bacterium SG7u.111]|nr:cellulase family glycosylhydrolase [Flammeovirgaceae bacterium SG7u.132]WPO34811.1 cellulase family glycosylhydrolase [Flammeovirgaceae bacterium SG7u.111]
MRCFNMYLIFLISFCFVSCTEESGEIEEIKDPVTLSATPASFEFEAEGGTHTLAITSNAVWKIAYTTGEWYRPSIQSVKGDASIDIIADENEDTAERSASLTLTAEGAADVVIAISQKGSEAVVVEPDPEEPSYIDPDNTGMRDLTSLQLSELMGAGWNVGNSLEAISSSGGKLTGSEVTWGNPVISQELIDSIKAAGFNAVRIPVSWSHNIEEGTDYKIKKEWLERVEEVANYVTSNQMYAIINVHWDGGWMDHPFYDQQDVINERLAAYWKQIAIHFRDHSDYLLFAGTNEVHVENDWGDPTAEHVAVQNSFNQTFVDAVRATGGRNSYRHLVVQGFNTNITHTVNHFITPTDSVDNKLMVEVHFYDPYEFALKEDAGGKSQWGKDFAGGDVATWGDEAWVDEVFGLMKTNFVDKGIPVVLGEYGAILRTSLAGQAYDDHVKARNYYLNYVTAAAKANGMIPVYWDNGNKGDKGFALFDRSTGEQVYPDAISAIVEVF